MNQSASLTETSDDIQRVERPTVETFYREFVSCRRPVILTGVMKQWRAPSLWTPDYLKTVAGEAVVPIKVSTDGIFSGDPKSGFAGRHRMMKLSSYIDLLTSDGEPGEVCYLQQRPISSISPVLSPDIEIPEYIEKKLPANAYLWLGPSSTVSPLHYDSYNNLLAQVSGRKKLVLFSPKYLSNLYPYPAHSKIPHLSQVNIDAPDLKKFPKSQAAKPVHVMLTPGEILFIPAFWWHQVYSLDMAVSVNFWWKPSFRHLLTVPGLRTAYIERILGSLRYLAWRLTPAPRPSSDDKADRPQGHPI